MVTISLSVDKVEDGYAIFGTYLLFIPADLLILMGL